MNRPGMTLVELLVVLVLLGLAASVVGLSLERWDRTVTSDPLAAATAELRRAAIDSARTITRTIVLDSTPRLITALPDGSVLTSLDAIDRFTGRPIARAK